MPARRTASFLIAASLLSTPAWALPMSPKGMPDIPSANQSPSVQRYEAGMSALTRKNWRDAETAFQEAAKLDPTSPLPLIGLADVAVQTNRNSAAWSWLQKAQSVAPKSGLPYHAMGRLHYQEKAYAKAEQALKKALSLSPDNPLFNLDMADLYANALKKPETAIPYYRKALALNPQHAGAHHGLGMVLWKTGKGGEAEPMLRKAVELAPANPLSRIALGTLLMEQNKPEAALAAFDGALKLDTRLVPAIMGKGDVYLGQGKMKEAHAAYHSAAQLAPKYDMAQLKLGMALQGLNRVKEAEKAYKAAISANPKLALAYNNLAWMAAENRSNLEQAAQWARKAVELAPAVPAFLDTLGWVYQAQGKYADAEKTLKQAIQLQAAAEFYYHLGVVYQAQSKTADAEAAFRKSLSMQQDFAPSRRALAALKGTR